jgi:hypothetical protein
MRWLRDWQARRKIAKLQKLRDQRLVAVLSANPPLPPSYERLALRIAELVPTMDNAAWNVLTDEQQKRYLDFSYIDRLLDRGEQPDEYLRPLAELRSIGHRLNAEGGISLMRLVASRAWALMGGRLFGRIEMHWDGIGDWQS